MPTDNDLIATESAEVETEHPTSIEKSESRHEKDVTPEKQATEALKVIRELQSSVFTRGRKFIREEMNER